MFLVQIKGNNCIIQKSIAKEGELEFNRDNDIIRVLTLMYLNLFIYYILILTSGLQSIIFVCDHTLIFICLMYIYIII